MVEKICVITHLIDRATPIEKSHANSKAEIYHRGESSGGFLLESLDFELSIKCAADFLWVEIDPPANFSEWH